MLAPSSSALPSCLNNRPLPPDAPRMLPSKSASSSKMPDQFKTRWTPPAKSVCCEMVRRGPAAKIQTTLSDRPNGWQAEQAPQPLLDILPTELSNSPTDVL